MKASAALTWRVMLIVAFFQGSFALGEGESLRSLIDQQLTVVSGLTPQRSTDAEFLRRVSIDLVGMPPTADEARAFLTDTAADKRERLVDRLFASPQFARRLAEMLDLMLMERRGYANVTADEWQAWLLTSVKENKPWNVLAREILQADGDDLAGRPAVRFTLDRGSEPNLLTRDIGRVFFGRDMQCAQCHDHPLVGDYLQSDYHGLLAFVAPTYAMVRKEGDKQKTVQAEKVGGDLTFQSVFVKKPRRTGARMPDGVALDEPFLLPGEDYEVAPADNVKPVPKFSRRAKLAELATNGANQAFNRNIVNRLWAYMFGRGLVHPVDWQHPDNPATNPELLKLLSERFAAMNFNIREFLREIALSNAYQRSYDLPAGLIALSKPASDEITRLKEQLAALEKAREEAEKAYQEAAEAWEKSEEALMPAAGELDAARTKYAEAKQKADEAVKAANDAKTQLTAKQNVAGPLQQAATAAEQAAKVLADDKELVEAAQKFVARSQKVTAELVVLTKTAEEKTAAVPPTTEALNNSKPVVDGALSKAEPLRTEWEKAEHSMRQARSQYDSASEKVAALERREETTAVVAKLEEQGKAIETAKQLVPTKQGEIAAAEKQLADYGPTVAQNEESVKAATVVLTTANEALAAASTEHAKRTDIHQTIAAAVAAADAARQKVADDPVLAETVKKLEERAELALVEVGDAKRFVDSTTTSQQAAANSVNAAKASLDAAVAERTRREQAIAAAKQALAAAQADVVANQGEFDAMIAELTDRFSHDFTITSLKPLTPEQLCWTVFRVTGVYERYWQTEVAELDKAKPLTEEQKKDAAQLAARDVELEQRTYDKLKGNIATFVAYYGAAAGQPQGDFFATADQALFAANGGSINAWVAPAAGNVTDRIAKQADARAAAEDLYLAVLTRLPSDEEAADVAKYLADHGVDKNAAAQELVWGLLNSAEFRFNH